MPPPALRASLGRIAHAFLLNHGGSAYLDEATVAADIDNNKLFIVPDAPTIERYAYAVYRHDNDRGVEIRNLLALFKKTVKQPGSLHRPGIGTARG
jgi:DNA-binding transcriptional LysR family regulator